MTIDSTQPTTPTGQNAGDVQTTLAVERNLLANERTYSAWTRTGLATLATAIGIATLADPSRVQPLILLIAATLVIVSAAIFLIALVRYRQTCRGLRVSSVPVTPLWVISALTVSLLVIAVLTLFLVIQF